jgi:hypothetical protein
MPDIASLLERTTPHGLVPPLDIDAVVRRSRRRRARRRALAASAAALAIGVVAATLSTVASAPGGDDVTMPLLGPGGRPIAEGAGAWSRVDDPPFAPRIDAFGGMLGDGRAIVWGGNPGGRATGSPSDVETGFADGGILDLDDGTWESIPPAPVPTPAAGAESMTSAQVVDDRLAVVTGAVDGSLHAAVYDVALGRWLDAPDQSDLAVQYDAVAWDGETLALVRTGFGGTGLQGEPLPGGQADAPVTLRWRPGDDRWTPGAPAPLGLRNYGGAAFDGSRLALWGGEEPSGGPRPGRVAGDGAIYDVAPDRWTAVPDGPLAARVSPAMWWSGGRLMIGGGESDVGSGRFFDDLAAYDPVDATWEELPAPPDGTAVIQAASTTTYDDGAVLPVVASNLDGRNDPPAALYGPAGWEEAPSGEPVDLGGFTVMLVGESTQYDGRSFPMRVRAAAGEWVATAEAPFPGRLLATIIGAPGGRMIVVGGGEGEDIEPATDTWVFDLGG